jgi:hypothetical protein
MSVKHGLNETYSTQEAKNFHLGQGGCIVLKEAGAGYEHSALGHYIAFMVFTDNVTISSTTLHTPEADAELVTIQNCPKGVMVYGAWERVSITRTDPDITHELQCIVYKG